MITKNQAPQIYQLIQTLRNVAEAYYKSRINPLTQRFHPQEKAQQLINAGYHGLTYSYLQRSADRLVDSLMPGTDTESTVLLVLEILTNLESLREGNVKAEVMGKEEKEIPALTNTGAMKLTPGKMKLLLEESELRLTALGKYMDEFKVIQQAHDRVQQDIHGELAKATEEMQDDDAQIRTAIASMLNISVGADGSTLELVQQVKSKLKETEGSEKELAENNKNLTHDNAALQQRLEKALHDNAQLRAAISDTRIDNQQLKGKVSELEQAYTQLKQGHENLERKHQDKIEEQIKTANQRDGAQRDLKRVNRELKTLKKSANDKGASSNGNAKYSQQDVRNPFSAKKNRK